MNIAINTLSIRSKYTGIGVYTKNLIHALSKTDKHNRYFLCLNAENYDDFAIEQANFENVLVRAPLKKYYLWEQFYLPVFIKKKRIDIIHGPRSVLPLLSGAKSVVTIHDLAFIHFPEVIRYSPINYWPVFVRRSAIRADHIIAVSKNTKKDIIRLFDIPENRITVTYEGCGDHFKKVTDKSSLATLSERYGLPERFILYVGNIEPRKNLGILLQALILLMKNHSLELKLVIVGKKGWLYSDFFKLIKQLYLENSIVFTGYVEDKDLPGIYSLADVFVYPSKYEGFGLPLLESMACGTPVIASNTSSIPEIVGASGLLFSPNRPDELAACINQLVNDPGLRARLVQSGIERSKLFSWKKMAMETLQIYGRVNDESSFH